MQALTIKDLSVTTELDSKAMGAVTGGMYKGYALPAFFGPQVDISKTDVDFAAQQMLGQDQKTLVNNGNNVAFSHGIKANVNPDQYGKNVINFG